MVVLTQSSNHKVTHGHAWKSRRLPEVFVMNQVSDHLEAVDVKVWTHEGIQQEKLATYVNNVQEFNEHVQGANVVAGSVVGQKAAANLSSKLADKSEVIIITMIVDGSVDELDCVAHSFVA